jgi:hypothetical protein
MDVTDRKAGMCTRWGGLVLELVDQIRARPIRTFRGCGVRVLVAHLSPFGSRTQKFCMRACVCEGKGMEFGRIVHVVVEPVVFERNRPS